MEHTKSMLNKLLKDAQFKRAFMKSSMENLEQDIIAIENEILEIIQEMNRVQEVAPQQ